MLNQKPFLSYTFHLQNYGAVDVNVSDESVKFRQCCENKLIVLFQHELIINHKSKIQIQNPYKQSYLKVLQCGPWVAIRLTKIMINYAVMYKIKNPHSILTKFYITFKSCLWNQTLSYIFSTCGSIFLYLLDYLFYFNVILTRPPVLIPLTMSAKLSQENVCKW